MKKVLITGKNSYIGKSVEAWLNHYLDEYQVTTIDMQDKEWIDFDFSSYDSVFHVAGIAHVSTNRRFESLYYEVNRDLVIKTALKAKKEGVTQFIFMSSMIVFSESNNGESIIYLNTIPGSNNSYGDSKLQAEEELRKLETSNFKVVIIRPPMIYGKGSKGNYPRLAKLAVKIPVFPDYDNKRSVLHIDNLCEFVKQVIDKKMCGTFHPQNKEYVSTAELVKKIAMVHGKKIILTKLFNPLIRILSKRVAIVGKVFGTQIYDKEMSSYENIDYQIRSFTDSIFLTENVARRDHEN